MSGAALLAGAGGACAAAAIVELAALRTARGTGAARPRRPAVRLVPLLARLGRTIAPASAPRELAARIDAAGAPLGLGVADLMALKFGAALAAGLVALGAGAVAPGRLGIAAVVGAPVLGFLAPDLALGRAARRRADAIALELADVAELLRVAVDAGLTPTRALAEVGRRHPGLLAAELRAAAERIALGVPRQAALQRLARRAPAPAVHALVAALDRAERHGSPLGPALAALAHQARADRSRRVRDRAARAAPKIQLVVALLLVPAVLLMVAASLAAALL